MGRKKTAISQSKLLNSTESDKEPEPLEPKHVEVTEARKPAATKHIDNEEKKKVSKHRTAKDLTEGGFSTYIGNVEDVDFSDPEQVLKASYNPKDFFFRLRAISIESL